MPPSSRASWRSRHFLAADRARGLAMRSEVRRWAAAFMVTILSEQL
jgi:hypothetical protein